MCWRTYVLTYLRTEVLTYMCIDMCIDILMHWRTYVLRTELLMYWRTYVLTYLRTEVLTCMCIDMRLDMRMDMHAQYSLMHTRYSRTTCSRMQPRRAGSAEQADLECAVRAVVVVECCRQLTHLQAFWALELAWPSRSCCRPSPGQFWPMDYREPNRYVK